jgi:hypothetical protein
MGIIMSGDFNADEVIAKIDKDIWSNANKTIPKYKFEMKPHHSTYHKCWTRC